MVRRLLEALVIASTVLALFGVSPVFAQSGTLNELPDEAQDVANSVLDYCKDMGYDLNHDTAPIENIGNNYKGGRLILFQPGDLCGYRDRGNGACSTDGCDFFVFSDRSGGQLSRIYRRSASGVVGFPKDGDNQPMIVFQSRGEIAPCNGKRQSTCIISLTWNGKEFVQKIIDTKANSKFVTCMDANHTALQQKACVAKLMGR